MSRRLLVQDQKTLALLHQIIYAENSAAEDVFVDVQLTQIPKVVLKSVSVCSLRYF